MNKYLIPLIITTGIGIYYFCNNRKNDNIKTLEIQDLNKDKTESNKVRTGKNIIKLKTILESNEQKLKELEELKQIKDKSKYQIVVYKKPEDWEIVD
tara:strand:+ start:160 stop:450 length:291 start_codon:yes stop_codon:yes gene_type:complete